MLSALCGHGKLKFLTILKKYRLLNDYIQKLTQENAEHDDIADAGERFLLALYDHTTNEKIYIDTAVLVDA